ncbi:MAG TPA: patatin-like phospholipase family protein, partial [Methanosarcina sp.]|nr:patatin-like phospholipase family protein [Methanosarcina sp.]
ISIIGKREWNRVLALLSFVRRASGIAIMFAILLIVLIIHAIHLTNFPISTSTKIIYCGLELGLAVTILYFTIPALLQIREIAVDKGIIPPSNLEAAIEKILSAKVQENYAAAGIQRHLPAKIRFCDIDPWEFKNCGFAQLKIAVTDITSGRLRLFGCDSYPNASISEVVAASVAIPFIFKPARINSVPELANNQFVDGGLISNLPVWSFAEEKAHEERRSYPFNPIPILAFTLEDGPDNDFIDTGKWWRKAVTAFRFLVFRKSKVNLRGYLNRVLRIGIFSSQSVTHDFVPDLHVFPLRSPLNTLDFDATWQKIRDGFNHGIIKRSKIRSPIIKRNEVQTKLQVAHNLVESILRDLSGQQWKGRIRLLIFQKIGRTSFKVTHHFNLGDDVDDKLTLDEQCPGVPEAFKKKSPVGLVRSTEHQSPADCVRLPMSKYEYVHMW